MKKSLFWFRNDLRLIDNHGLYNSLKESDSCVCVYIFDKKLMAQFPPNSYFFNFLYRSVKSLKNQLRALGSDLIVMVGDSTELIPKIARRYNVNSVYANEEYEVDSIARDSIVKKQLESYGINQSFSKDTVIFSPEELKVDDSYVLDFASYNKCWRDEFKSFMINEYNSIKYINNLSKFKINEFPSYDELGFKFVKIPTKLDVLGSEPNLIFDEFINKKLGKYFNYKNNPSSSVNSYLSVYINFGIVNVRQVLRRCFDMKTTMGGYEKSINSFIDQLVRREYCLQISYNFPSTKDTPFLSYFNSFPWDNNQSLFSLWCEGLTGFPIVDAIMRCLNKTGYIHYKYRILTSIFLCKYLNIDYRLGEQYFAMKLIDYNPSINNCNWQYVASTSYDSLSYLAIPNIDTLSEVYDKECKFIKKFIPELKNAPNEMIHRTYLHIESLKELGIIIGETYPDKIVDLVEAKNNTIERFNEFLNEISEE